jgi:hypothetical protein
VHVARSGSFDALSGSVARGVAEEDLRERAPERRERRDRPLGKRDADVLAQVPLFAGLSRRHLKQIAEHADEVAFRKGEAIVEEDQPGGSFFVLLEG